MVVDAVVEVVKTVLAFVKVEVAVAVLVIVNGTT